MDPLKIYCQFFWMKAWGHSTAKRTFVVSNLPRISFLDCGSMTRSQLSSTVETTTTYVSKDGRKRFKGNANLKATELLAQLSVFHVVPFWYYPFPFPNLVGNWTADLSWIADPFPTTCHFPAGFLLPQKKNQTVMDPALGPEALSVALCQAAPEHCAGEPTRYATIWSTGSVDEQGFPIKWYGLSRNYLGMFLSGGVPMGEPSHSFLTKPGIAWSIPILRHVNHIHTCIFQQPLSIQ